MIKQIKKINKHKTVLLGLLSFLGALLLVGSCGVNSIVFIPDAFPDDEELLKNQKPRKSIIDAQVGYFGGTVVVVGTEVTVLISQDGGFNWSINKSIVEGDNLSLNGVAYHRPQTEFYIAGTSHQANSWYNQLRGYKSKDGVIWNNWQRRHAEARDINQLSYGVGMAGANRGHRRTFMLAVRSGTTLIHENHGTGPAGYDMADNGSITVMATTSGAAYLTNITASAFNYSHLDVTPSGNNRLRELENIRGTTDFLAVGRDGYIYKSTNGLNWTKKAGSAYNNIHFEWHC